MRTLQVTRMKNVSEQKAADAPQKAGIGLSLLMALSGVLLGFVGTGVIAIVVIATLGTTLTFYAFALLWLVLACAGLFAGQKMLRRTAGVWAYLLASVLVIVFVYLLAWTQYLLILL